MRRYFIFLFCVIFINTLSASGFQKGSIEYRLSMPHPHTHYFEVEIILRNYLNDFVDFKIPVWTPGSYLIREYAKNVENFSVTHADKREVKFHKINKNTWRIEHKKEAELLIKYRVYAFEGSVRMSYLDDEHAFIMANTTLMFVEDLRDEESLLIIERPIQWKKITTTLTKLKGNTDTFIIPNYDILIDSPIEIGNHDIIEFEASGVMHEVVMYGAFTYDADKIKSDLIKIVESATEIFGENPNEQYIFFVHHSDKSNGGLEHLNSTVLEVSRWAYTNSKLYDSFLGLAAHEYFHLWMVKRLKPVEFKRFNYDKENYTDMLWVMEGITSYYDEKIMLKSGFHDDSRFITILINAMANIENTPGATVQTVSEASFDAWIKFYRKNKNSNNNQISYYTKGMIVGALLDLEIIYSSKGRKSLDDVVGQLYEHFYKKMNRGIVVEDLKKAAEKACGHDLVKFFNDYVYGTKYLDNIKHLRYAGIELVKKDNSQNANTIGANVKIENEILTVESLKKGGSAYENGLNIGDELISINGFRANKNNVASLINKFDVGEKVEIQISRKGIIKKYELDIRIDEKVSYSYEEVANKTKLQERVYNKWMNN